jgi:hypothetical protein
MSDIDLYSKLIALPDELKQEADDYVDFLGTKAGERKTIKRKKAGLAEGLIEMRKNFDEPLDDFKEYRI